MSGATSDVDKLTNVLNRLLKEHAPAKRMPENALRDIEPACALLVYSFLLWESTPKHAAAGINHLGDSIIDLNDLRVAMPAEIVEITSMRDGLALERAERLRATLNDIYRREHIVTLARLESISKREVRDYLDGLEGMPAFVSARMTLLGFGGHAVPLDAKLQKLLTNEGVFPSGTPLAEAEHWLERQIRATDAVDIALLLEGWRDNDRQASPKKDAKEPQSSEAQPDDLPGKST